MYIKLAFSPCPNDTFIFYAMVHGKIDTEGLNFDYRMDDVESLNRLALSGNIDMVKISYHTWVFVIKQYILLESGSALGFGNGPLLIAKRAFSREEMKRISVAIPGVYTTAHLLLRIAYPEIEDKRFMVFSEIEDAILEGKVDAGVIIHENRFTYEEKGLQQIVDLGAYWESLTQSPIPLGGIAVKNTLPGEIIAKLQRIMRRSVTYALENPSQAMPFVKCNAKEMDEAVMKKHIDLYVNDFTVDLGSTGKKAVLQLLHISQERGLAG